MAVFSKELCQKKLNTWMKAEEAIATGQSYQIGSRMLTRADLKQVREEMEYWAGNWPRRPQRRSTGAEPELSAVAVTYKEDQAWRNRTSLTGR